MRNVPWDVSVITANSATYKVITSVRSVVLLGGMFYVHVIFPIFCGKFKIFIALKACSLAKRKTEANVVEVAGLILQFYALKAH